MSVTTGIDPETQQPTYKPQTGMNVTLSAVVGNNQDPADENNAFAYLTPTGQVSIRIINDNIREADFFESGAEYRVTFEKVEKPAVALPESELIDWPAGTEPTPIARVPVTSGNVASVGYDADEQRLEVQFKRGGIYAYAGVPAAVHAELMAAPSIGSYLATSIKPIYTCEKVEPTTPAAD
jgi:hypothetical protein